MADARTRPLAVATTCGARGRWRGCLAGALAAVLAVPVDAQTPAATPLSTPQRCTALDSWRVATADLPQRDDNRELRGEIYYELQQAERLAGIAKPDYQTWRECEESFDHLLKLVPDLPPREGLEARVREERDHAHAMVVTLTPPPPPVDPVAEWTRKRRRLEIQTGISGAFVVSGLLIAFVPLLLPCGGSYPESADCEPYVQLFLTLPVGLAMAAAAAFPLAIYGSRLADHKHEGPPKPRSHVRVVPFGLVGRF